MKAEIGQVQAIFLSSLASHSSESLKKAGGCLGYLHNTRENVTLMADFSEKCIREGLVLEGDRELEIIASTLRHKGGFSFAERVSVFQQFGPLNILFI